MIWEHEVCVIGLPQHGIPLDAIADAATNHDPTFLPHANKVLEQHPGLRESIERVLYDSACDDAALKQQFREESGLDLKASLNPRRSQPITKDLPRGIEKITPCHKKVNHKH